MDKQEDSAALAERLGITFPILIDDALAVTRSYQLVEEGKDIALPATFVLDREGVVVLRKIGENVMDRPKVEEVLAAVATVAAG